MPIAASGAPVVAVEIDRDLVQRLAPHLPANVTLVAGDVLATDFLPVLAGLQAQRPPDWRGPADPARRFRLIGNLPYNISTPFLFRVLDLQQNHQFFSDATLMVQREVATRLSARPGTRDYGVLTVFAALRAHTRTLFDLPPGAFHPAPRVHSSLVRLEFGPLAARLVDERVFALVVRRIFMQRRKTLANALRPLGPDALDALQATGLDGRRRPETLEVAELARLADAVAARLPAARKEPVL
jgi:16S rRNA (adenine1518-N6/adenine1519-N6)-dimethyltransferase